MDAILPKNIENCKVLFSALNWGYGHVMRSIVLLHQFENQGCELFVACTSEQERLFKTEGISATFIRIGGYPFNFSGQRSLNLDLIRNFKNLVNYMKSEQYFVERLCKQHGIQYVIADQSMGFYSRQTTSILITHQVQLPLNFYEKGAQWLYNSWLRNFQHIWIPDVLPPHNLAGKLSATKLSKASYIGFLSRFKSGGDCSKTYSLGALITGPEPYARDFFESCKTRFLASGQKSFIIYDGAKAEKFGDLEILQHQPTSEMQCLLTSAELLVSRSGYSTLMDLQVLGVKNVELHPTPGQAEQEYLWRRHKKSHQK